MAFHVHRDGVGTPMQIAFLIRCQNRFITAGERAIDEQLAASAGTSGRDQCGTRDLIDHQRIAIRRYDFFWNDYGAGIKAGLKATGITETHQYFGAVIDQCPDRVPGQFRTGGRNHNLRPVPNLDTRLRKKALQDAALGGNPCENAEPGYIPSVTRSLFDFFRFL